MLIKLLGSKYIVFLGHWMTTLTIEHHNILHTKAAIVRETIKHNKKTKPNQKPSISNSLKMLALFMDSQFVKILLQLILLFVEN